MALLRVKVTHSHDRGFTLLETLVALVITSLSLVIVLQSISGSFRTRALSQKTYEMAQFAESKLDELEVITVYPPRDISGQINESYNWSASFLKYETTNTDIVEAYWMTVNIIDANDSDKSFELERLIMFEITDNE